MFLIISCFSFCFVLITFILVSLHWSFNLLILDLWCWFISFVSSPWFVLSYHCYYIYSRPSRRIHPHTPGFHRIIMLLIYLLRCLSLSLSLSSSSSSSHKYTSLAKSALFNKVVRIQVSQYSIFLFRRMCKNLPRAILRSSAVRACIFKSIICPR